MSDLSDERWEALARFLAGECDTAEAADVRAWLADRPDRDRLIRALDRTLQRLAGATAADLDIEAALRSVRSRMQDPAVVPIAAARPEPRRSFGRTKLLRIAAGIALVIGAGVVWRATRDEAPPVQAVAAARTWSTAIGRTETIRLADGTSILLAPGSRLVVAHDYGETTREVELTGEALFDVSHDAARPFTVRAGSAAIEDLGTTFTVRSSGVDGVLVVVTEGAVRLRAQNAPVEAGIVLRAGQRGTLVARGVVEQGDASDDDVAWTRGRLVFVDAPLERVRDDMRRWYGIELRVEGPAPGSLNAAFEEGESVQDVLEIISLALGGTLDRSGDTAIVRVPPGGPSR